MSNTFRTGMTPLVLAVSLGIMLSAVMQSEPLKSANDRSRWCTVWSLVERGTYQIDEIIAVPGWDSIDKVRHDGHFYSSKPPFLSTLVAGVTRGIQSITGWSINTHLAEVTWTILIIFNVIPMLLILWIWSRLLDEYVTSQFARYFLLITAAFGTLITPFLLTLNNHTPAAMGMVVSIYALLRIISSSNDDAPTRMVHPIWYAVVGFASAWTCSLELPAALWGVWTFLWLAMRDIRRTCLWYLPAAIILLAFFFATNIYCTGDIKPFYMSYGTEKYVYVHEGIPSYWSDPKGLDRNLDSFGVYLLHCLVGHHGIFSLSPVFLLMIPGWIFAIRQARMASPQTTSDADPQEIRRQTLARVILSGCIMTIIVMAFYLTRFDNYNYGGNSIALRWVIWLIPCWLMGLIPVLERFSQQRQFQYFAALLLCVSTYSVWSAWPNPWQHPWIFTLMDQGGWLDRYHEVPPPFDRPLNTWIRSLPDVAEGSEPVWIEMSTVSPRGTIWKRKLIGRGFRNIAGEKLYHLEIVDASLPTARQWQTYYIDRASFERGDSPETFLRWPTSDQSDTHKTASIEYLRGLPGKRGYRPGLIRYLKLPLPISGVRTQRAASQVDLRVRDLLTTRRYRADLWLSESIPFGIAQIETTVSNTVNGEVVTKESWTVTAVSQLLTP
ncbi:MAG: hypothetical protein ACKVT0_24160 [Planctomycetaceae bacterium]